MNKNKIIIMFVLIVLIVPMVNAGKVVYHMKIKGTSMLPNITSQQLLNVTTITKEDKLINGNVYCYKPNYNEFQTSYSYICHRLVKMYRVGENKFCLFRGDNNPYNDPIVNKKQVVLQILE